MAYTNYSVYKCGAAFPQGVRQYASWGVVEASCSFDWAVEHQGPSWIPDTRLRLFTGV